MPRSRVAWRGFLAISLSAIFPTPAWPDTQPPAAGLTRDALQSIVDRNPFALKPVPPPQVIETPKPETKLNIHLTGIVRSRKGKTVHLVVLPEAKGANPPAGASPTYLSIEEGGRENGIEVLEINNKSDEVKILNAGIETLLTFKTHGMKSTAPPPAAANKPGVLPPGVMPQPGQNLNNRGVTGPTIISRGGVTTTSTLPNPSITTGGLDRFGAQNQANNSVVGAGASRGIPSRTLRTQPNAQADDAGVPGHEKAVVQVIQMEAQKIANPNLEFPPTPGAP